MAQLVTNISRTGRSLRLEELQKALGMSRGTMQPWDLPEYRPMVQENRAQTDRTLSSLPGMFQRTGVSGPAAGLTMERVAGAGDNGILDLINKMRFGVQQGAVDQAQQEERLRQSLFALMQQDKQRRGMNQWTNPQTMMEMIKSLMSAGGAVAAAAV